MIIQFFRTKKDIIEFIYKLLHDKNEAPIVRASAFDAILEISPIPAKDWPEIKDLENIDDHIDWEFIKKIVNEAQ